MSTLVPGSSGSDSPAQRFSAYGKGVTRVRPPSRHAELRSRLDCAFDVVDEVFDECVDDARRTLDDAQLLVWIDQARWLGKLGRGPEALLVFLEVWPGIASTLTKYGKASSAAEALQALAELMSAMQKSPNARAIATLLQSLGAVTRRLKSPALLGEYFALVRDLMMRTQISIHGRHATGASPGLPSFLTQAPTLVGMAPLAGLRRWVDAGIRMHRDHPQQQQDFFSLNTADARILLQRERRGVLLVDIERQLELGLRALWGEPALLVAFPVDGVDDDAGDEESDGPVPSAAGRWPVLPHMENDGWRLPEVLDGRAGVSAHMRYNAAVAHLAAHRRWSCSLIADNWSPMQRLAVETFEDARIDHLLVQRLPGLHRMLLALHPIPRADDAGRDPGISYLRLRLTRLSRALLESALTVAAENPGATGSPGDSSRHDADAEACPETQPETRPEAGPDARPDANASAIEQEFVARFHALLRDGPADTHAMAALALRWVARTRVASDQFARVHFRDTWVDYRDDNRHLWRFIQAGEDEDADDDQRRPDHRDDIDSLPPRHYPEWDASSRSMRPDWASVYDVLQPAGNPADIDALLARHAAAARHLKRLLDLFKPQDRARLRYQEEGAELDLDVALRTLVDWRAGAQPDPRVMMSTRTDGRSIAVLLLIDLSASVNDGVPGTDTTVLSLSRAAAAMLAWAIDALGDQLAIAGFHSNTRHEVRYLHIKGFAEPWGDAPKARLAGMQGAWSTRMGAALRHAGHLLSGRNADKRLLLVLTDGQPADIDVLEPQYLEADAAQAVRELKRDGLYTHCISLDAKADDYVGRIFGPGRYTVVDRVAQLPQRLPEVFLALTR